jgi:ATP/maltotriose-dependent transcriptional regulator MalT
MADEIDKLLSPPLSPRELEVLQLLAEGLVDSDIADLLVVSPSTVKSHLKHLYRKLEVPGRAGAVAKGMRLGLIE